MKTILALLTAVHAYAAAPTWKQPQLTYETNAREPFLAELAGQVNAPDAKRLVFTKKSGSYWLTVTPAGQVGGVPEDHCVGTHKLVVEVKDENGVSSIPLTVRVQPKNHPPRWDDAALRFSVKERDTLRIRLDHKPFVDEPDKDKLTFTLDGDAVNWVRVSSAGELVATPAFAQIGEYSFPIRVSDGREASTGTLQIVVERAPRPPQWKQRKLELEGKAQQPVSANLKPFATDLDGLPLVFAKKSGPTWAKISLDGMLTGTPDQGDVGTQEIIVSAKNDSVSSDLKVAFNVIFNRRPPFFIKANPVLPPGKIGEDYTANLGTYAVDPDPPHSMDFEIISGPNWVKLEKSGRLDSTKELADVGTFPIVVRATNSGGLLAQTTFQLTVAPRNQPPKVLKNPVPLPTLQVGELLIFDMKPAVEDPDHDKLTFRDKRSPDWISVARTGELTGVPGDIDVGQYEVDIIATDGRAEVHLLGQGQVVAKKPGVLPPPRKGG